jgi:anti-sigma factor RsiW
MTMTNKTDPACLKLQEKLNSFLDNALAGRDAVDLAAHLETCVACYQEFRKLEAVRDAVRHLPAPSSSDAVRMRAFQRLENVVHAEERQPSSTKRNRSSWLSLRGIIGWGPALATLTAAAAAAGLVFLIPMAGPSPSPDFPSTISVPGDAEIHALFTLHDAHAIEWTGDESLARRDAAAQAHGALLGSADASVVGSL